MCYLGIISHSIDSGGAKKIDLIKQHAAEIQECLKVNQ